MSEAKKKLVADILAKADIQVGGSRAWDIQIKNDDFFARVMREGSLGLGESYTDGWWEAESLDEFSAKLLGAKLDTQVKLSPRLAWQYATSKVSNRQRKGKAYEIGEKHYDIGNDVYRAMLDKRLVYTCGYWKDADNLDDAQEAKLDLVCRKIELKEGMKVLDIGCGWGSFAKFAAEEYGVEVVGVTVSKEQVELGNKLCAGLPVELKLQDYREMDGQYDRIVSLGMFEHVGYKNYEVFMKKVKELLVADGLFLLHTIGNIKSVVTSDPWIDRYIFPGGILPSIEQVGVSVEDLFVMEDWHNFGADYDNTLMQWFRNFDAAWPGLKEKYGETFYRMWKYYLLSLAGSFRVRRIQLWQIVLSPKGVRGGYVSVR